MKGFNWKAIVPYAVIVVLFAVAAAIYFFPSLQGKVIYAGDSINAIAAVQESKAYHEAGGNRQPHSIQRASAPWSPSAPAGKEHRMS